MGRWRLLLAVALVAAAATAGCIRDFEEDEEPSRLQLHDVDVAAPHVTTGTASLEVSPTLVNRGGETGSVNLTVKAYDTQTGLLVDEARASLGTVPAGVTRTTTVPVEVPREHGVRIRVEVHEDDQLQQSGDVEVRNLAGLQPTVHDTPLGIGEMDFVVRDVTDGANRSRQVRIETKVYLTNEGDSVSSPVRMQVRAREADTSLLGDEAWADVGPVQPEATRIVSVNLTVPDEHNYLVQTTLWDGDFVLERGQGQVQLLPTFERDADTELDVSDPDVRDFQRSRDDRTDAARGGDGGEGPAGDGANVPGPGIGAAAAALAGAALAATRAGGRP